MKLLYSPNSPYSRKCRVVIREKGLEVQEVIAMPMEDPAELLEANPLGAVPALVTDSGETFCDSPLICEILDAKSSEAAPIIPKNDLSRLRALKLAALGDGLMDAAVACFIENRKPEEKRAQEWINRKERAIMRTIDMIAQMKLEANAPLNIGTIAIACALDYIRFRLVHLAWQDKQPELAQWFEETLQHPSFAATAPIA